MRAPPPIDRDKKRIFSRRDQLAICANQVNDKGEIPCAVCSEIVALFDGKDWSALRAIEFDHEREHGFGGRTTPENGRIVCKHLCHRILTNATIKRAAKADAQGARTGQHQKRMAGKSHRWPKRGFGR